MSNSKPQASKRARAQKSVPVRAHQRNLTPKLEPKIKPRMSLAERFRGQR